MPEDPKQTPKQEPKIVQQIIKKSENADKIEHRRNDGKGNNKGS